MKHIIGLANAPYVWPSWTRHGGANPAPFLPVLIAALTPAGMAMCNEGFLSAAFASKKLLLIQMEQSRQNWASGEVISFALQCRYASFMILSSCKMCSLNRIVRNTTLCVVYYRNSLCPWWFFYHSLGLYSWLTFLLSVCVQLKKPCKHETDTFGCLGLRVGLEVVNSRGIVRCQAEAKKKYHKD